MTRRRPPSGFTLIEVMMVVLIIGFLAAIAIPAFTRYIAKSRTPEAAGMVNKMWSGSIAYYQTDHMDNSIPPKALPKQFPRAGMAPTFIVEATPGGLHCGCQSSRKCPGGGAQWADDAWTGLQYSQPNPHSYVSYYEGSGTEQAAQFTAMAVGDLDCDTILSQFMRRGNINPTRGDVTGGGQPTVINEVE